MTEESELIQSVYAVTVEPERYDDLVVTWVEKLSAALFLYEDDPDDSASAALNEHVNRATKVIALLAASRAEDLPAEFENSNDEVLQDTQPVMRIDGAGLVLSANSAATRAYAVSQGNKLEHLPFDVAAIRTIHALATKLLRTTPAATSAARKVQESNAAVPLIHAVRVDTDQSVYLSLMRDASDPEVLVLTSTDIIWPDRLTALMSDSFDLTAAECEVGKGLVEGLSMHAIAELRASSVATVRVHARSLFSKTSTSGQREFIRMAIGLVTLYPQVDEPVDAQTAGALSGNNDAIVLPTEGQWQRLTLRDGRRLPYAILGAPDGRPCLYVHDAMFGPTLPAELVSAITERGLKLIVFARQGWMGAPQYPEAANAFDQCAQDCKALMQYLQLEGVLLLGRVLGVTYAYEILQLDPARYVGLMGITPALPVGEREDINKMAPHHRLLTISIGANPTLLKFVTRAGSAIYDRFGAARFLSMIYRSTREDMALIDDPTTFAAMDESLKLGGGGANHPFFKDLIDRPSAAWHPGLAISVPFHALLGEKDPSARRRRAERMIELGVPLSLTLLPEVGELFIYARPELVADEILHFLKAIDSARAKASG